mmetsp:Transcript_52037/g.144091  ORF Transcript_52037/g.144091 Transcript_52037/m.144091 type:complete len:246 (-) Transcript_52037:180-917(-)
MELRKEVLHLARVGTAEAVRRNVLKKGSHHDEGRRLSDHGNHHQGAAALPNTAQGQPALERAEKGACPNAFAVQFLPGLRAMRAVERVVLLPVTGQDCSIHLAVGLVLPPLGAATINMRPQREALVSRLAYPQPVAVGERPVDIQPQLPLGPRQCAAMPEPVERRLRRQHALVLAHLELGLGPVDLPHHGVILGKSGQAASVQCYVALCLDLHRRGDCRIHGVAHEDAAPSPNGRSHLLSELAAA